MFIRMLPPFVTYLFGLIVVCFLLVFRLPERFFSPFFFAEEGYIYFKYAFEHAWWETLLTPHLGYYSLWNNVATALAAHAVPLEYAPHITLSCGVIIWLLALLCVCLPGSVFKTPQQQVLAWLVIMLIPPLFGKTNVAFSQFLLCVCTGLIITSEPVKRRWVRYGKYGIATLAGLTGVLSVFLAPVAMYRYYHQRQREFLMHALILAFCGAIQCAVFLYAYAVAYETTHYLETRYSSISDIDDYLAATVNKGVIFPLAGYEVMRRTGEEIIRILQGGKSLHYYSMLVAFTLIFIGIFMAGHGRKIAVRHPPHLFMVSYLAVLIPSLALASAGEDKLSKDMELATAFMR